SPRWHADRPLVGRPLARTNPIRFPRRETPAYLQCTGGEASLPHAPRSMTLTIPSTIAEPPHRFSKLMSFDKSVSTMKQNAEGMAGGVSSNFRLNISPTPLAIERGEGPYLFDVDGNRLIDYYLGMGPMLLGHNPKPLLDAVRAEMENGI